MSMVPPTAQVPRLTLGMTACHTRFNTSASSNSIPPERIDPRKWGRPVRAGAFADGVVERIHFERFRDHAADVVTASRVASGAQ